MRRNRPGSGRIEKKLKLAKKFFRSTDSLKNAEIMKNEEVLKSVPLQLLRILMQVSKEDPIKKTSFVHLFAILKHLARGHLDLRDRRSLKSNLLRPFIRNWEQSRDEATKRFLISTLLVRLLLDARELGGRVKAFLVTTLPEGSDREIQYLLGKPFFSKLLQRIKEKIQDLEVREEVIQREIYDLFSPLAEWMEKERLSQLDPFFSLSSALEGKRTYDKRDISFSFLVENFLQVVWKIKIPLEEQNTEKEIKVLRDFKQMLEETSENKIKNLTSTQPRDFSVLSSISTHAASLRKKIQKKLQKYLLPVDVFLALRERIKFSSRQKMEKMRDLLFGSVEEKAFIGKMKDVGEASLWEESFFEKLERIRSKAIQLQKNNEKEFQRGTSLPEEIQTEISILYKRFLQLLKAESEKALQEFKQYIRLSQLINACFFNNRREIESHIAALYKLEDIFLVQSE